VPFWLHEHRIISIIKSIPVSHKILAGFIGTAFLAAIWFFALYRPLLLTSNQKQQRCQELEKQILSSQKSADRFNAIYNDHQRLVDDYKKLIAKSITMQQAISSILSHMQQCGVSCRGIRPQSTTESETCNKYALSVKGKGTFDQLIRFLKVIAHQKIPFTVSSLKVQKSKQKMLAMECIVRVVSVKDSLGYGS